MTRSADQGILDTSTVILLDRLRDPSELPDEPLITAVTLAELSVGPLVTSDDAERAARQARLQQAEADFDPLPFDAAAARTFGRVAASLRASGRKVPARTYDAMIAATAVANNVPLYTVNPVDFEGMVELDLRSIRHPDLLDPLPNTA
jgi:predicted nucleic acid-binding protein